jgi:DHA1 family bicyclomycin/chloramphenicol resistance-like MFS transporter
MYLPALPSLTRSMNASESAVQLTLTATFVGLMIGQLIFGPLSDSVGRRRLLLVVTFGTLGATIACALAPTIVFLTAARLILGIAGGAGIVIGRAVAADIAKGPEAARIFSLLMSIVMIAPLVGPLVGAALLSWTDTWRSGFVFLAGVLVLLVSSIALFVPETLPRARRHSGGVAELRKSVGVMFRDRVFLGYAITQVFGFATMFAYLASSSFVFQETFGLTPVGYSLLFGGIVPSIVIAAFLNRRLLLIWDPRRILVVALVIAAVASIVLIPVMAASDPSMGLMIVTLVFLIGTRAPVGANSMALALERAEFAGTASAIVGAMGIGGALVATPILAILPVGAGVGMAVTMAICSVLALLSTVILSRKGDQALTAAAVR